MGSRLVRRGFRLTQLRGAYFTVAATAYGTMPSTPSTTTVVGEENDDDERPVLCAEGEGEEEEREEDEGKGDGDGEKEEGQPVRRVWAGDVEAMMERKVAVVRFDLFEAELPFAWVDAYGRA